MDTALDASMFGLNRDQKAVFDTTENTVLVNAGAGTGKTNTVAARYLNLLGKVSDQSRIILLTFTRSGASEMRAKVRDHCRMLEENGHKVEKYSDKQLRASTFDSFCTSVLHAAPESAGRFFMGADGVCMSRDAAVVESDYLNKAYFRSVLMDNIGLVDEKFRGVFSRNSDSLYKLIERLLSFGIFPVKDGWFGGHSPASDPEAIRGYLSGIDEVKFDSKLASMEEKAEGEYTPEFAEIIGRFGSESKDERNKALIDTASVYSTEKITEEIRKLFWIYICRSLTDSRLTYGLNALFAFVSVYDNQDLRRNIRCDYLIVDEFQDTNRQQLMLALMLLEKPNLCAVGDWRQSIYGFRNTSDENINGFDLQVDSIFEEIGDRINFARSDMRTLHLSLGLNYRSDDEIIKCAYSALFSQRKTDDDGNPDGLTASRADLTEDLPPKATMKIRFCEVRDEPAISSLDIQSKNKEAKMIVSLAAEYTKGNFVLNAHGGKRPDFGDIAVLCRNNGLAMAVLKEARGRGIPTYFNARMDLLECREGILLLAWLRILVDFRDRRGLYPILFQEGFSRSEARTVVSHDPGTEVQAEAELKKIVKELRQLIDRPLKLSAKVFSLYSGLDRDNVQMALGFVEQCANDGISTLADIVSAIESSTDVPTDYPVCDAALTVETIHQSKGLKYPVVIVGGLDTSSFPSTKTDNDVFRYSKQTGIIYTGLEGVDAEHPDSRSWQEDIVSLAYPDTLLEEERLLFVAISRAEEYVALAADSPSEFYNKLCDELDGRQVGYDRSKEGRARWAEKKAKSEREKTDAENREKAAGTGSETGMKLAIKFNKEVRDEYPQNELIGVHRFLDIHEEAFSAKEGNSHGMEYGTRLHYYAECLANGIPEPDATDLDEKNTSNVKRVIDGLCSEGFEMAPEIECTLNLGKCKKELGSEDGKGILLNGTMDLLAWKTETKGKKTGTAYRIYDWKTDCSETYLEHYKRQLTIYALALSKATGAKINDIQCFLEFVELGKEITVIPQDSYPSLGDLARKCKK